MIWPFGGLLLGLFLGLSLGLLLGRLVGLDAFVNHFLLRFFLSWQGKLSWDLVLFLDEMAERLLLRKVDGSYIFVHRLLQMIKPHVFVTRPLLVYLIGCLLFTM